MSANKQVQQVCQDIEGANMVSVADSVPRGGECLEDTNMLLAGFHEATQLTILALLFGILTAMIEGEPCEADKDGLMTFEDRLDIFLATARMAHKETLQFKAENEEEARRILGVPKRRMM